MKDSKLGLFLALLLAGSMWFYVQRVLIPSQQADAAIHGTPRGNLSDLYPRWLGARELLLHHRDPYSPEVTREIQMGYYGRVLDPARAQDPQDQQGFAYPVYVVFLLGPAVGSPFNVVQTGFRCLLIIMTVATVLLWLHVLRWRPPLLITIILAALTVGSFPFLQGIKLQQLSLLVSGLIAGSAALLVAGDFISAGILLALATIKPQLVAPLVAWLLLWAVSDWHSRKNLVWGFVLTLASLVGAGEYVLPGWIGRFREAISSYRQYTGGAASILEVLTTPGLGKALTLIILLALIAIGWRHRHIDVDAPVFRLMLVLTLAVTVVIVPKTAPYNHLLLLPGVLLLAQQSSMLWRKNRLIRAMLVLSIVLVFWPWLAAVALTFASLFLPAESVQKAWAVPVYTSLAIPLAIAALLAFNLRDLAGSRQRAA